MTTAPVNTRLLYPSFDHFRYDVYKCRSVDDLNNHVRNLQKARTTTGVHAFTSEEIARAWGLIRWKGKSIPGAYELPSDKSWRVAKTA